MSVCAHEQAVFVHAISLILQRTLHRNYCFILQVQPDMVCAVGERCAVLLVLLNLSAAFDAIDHCSQDYQPNVISSPKSIGMVCIIFIRLYENCISL